MWCSLQYINVLQVRQERSGRSLKVGFGNSPTVLASENLKVYFISKQICSLLIQIACLFTTLLLDALISNHLQDLDYEPGSHCVEPALVWVSNSDLER